ncbi:MAG TPA: CcoQ/FixQ family Cbb3-type cytochrome c oxidase assembly chaperone [Gammaproteobacteria bacterium]|nr:CcoQ/FixQ family Cbb3-type cytochrome c oxidase assembly chaperone [Gammaproteobacteria bacterium]
MDIVMFHSIWTVALLVLFIGIWAWAWSSKRKPDFEAAARLPLDDDNTLTTRRGENNNG